MADFKDDYYAEVDNVFSDLRGHPFDEGDLLQPTPQERGVPLGPSGWVENADGADGEAKVIINADGLTVLDGKISIKDAGGSSVLSAAGFDGSWTDFIETGVYNSHFQYGTTNVITAATEVGGGEGTANYEASLSDDIPYWVLATVSSGLTLTRVADPTAVGGYALFISGGSTNQLEMYQDIPIVSGQEWDLLFYWKHFADVNNYFNLTIHSYWMDENHKTISNVASSGLLYTADQSTYFLQRVESIDTAIPTNARYLRLVVLFTFTQDSATTEAARVYLNGIRLTPKINYGKQEFPDGIATIDADSIVTDKLTGTITVETVDADQNNWNPVGLASIVTIVVTGLTAARTITGMVAQGTGRVIHILNQSGQSLVLAHESASSTDVNRFACPGAANLTVRQAGGVTLVYAVNRWRVASP